MIAANPNANRSEPSDREIVFTRVFNAPRDLVYAAWTDPRQIERWWGPDGFTTQVHAMDVRPGGEWRLTMTGPDGHQYKNRIVFREVAAPERLVYEHLPEPGSEPLTFVVTVTFTTQGGNTEVTMRMLFPSPAARDQVVREHGAIEGGNQTLARLAGVLAQDEKARLEISRLFNAPRERVFSMWTTPEDLARWWGPRGFTLSQCQMRFAAGGGFRLVMRAPDGQEHPFAGEFVETAANERIVFRGTINDDPAQVVHTTVTFADEAGRTRLTVRQIHAFRNASTEGAQTGWTQTLDRLAAALAGFAVAG